MAAPLVPFTRNISVGCVGKDVEGVKRALSRAGFMKWTGFSRIAGPFFKRSIQNFQRAKGIEIDGVYGLKTHSLLRSSRRKRHPREWAFDAYAAKLMREYFYNNTGEQAVRKRIVDAALYAVEKQDVILYSQARPMSDFAPPPNVPASTDCSGFVTWCYKSAGAPDPNAQGYNGYGYTGTLWTNGTRTSKEFLKPGDLIFYGRPMAFGGGAHVTLYVGGGKCASHGQDAGPDVRPIEYRSDVYGYRTYRVV